MMHKKWKRCGGGGIDLGGCYLRFKCIDGWFKIELSDFDVYFKKMSVSGWYNKIIRLVIS